MTEEKKLAALLQKQPRQDILALANSLHGIVRAQVAAGKKLSAEEQAILDRATAQLPSLNSRS